MFSLVPQHFNKTFDNFFNDFDHFLDRSSFGTNIVTEDNQYQIPVDVPGFTKNDLEINIDDQKILITGQKEIGKINRHINKAFTIPSDVDIDQIEASIENGILNLTLPRGSPTSKKTIKIK